MVPGWEGTAYNGPKPFPARESTDLERRLLATGLVAPPSGSWFLALCSPPEEMPQAGSNPGCIMGTAPALAPTGPPADTGSGTQGPEAWGL